jgi:type II secretory pathway predicted ATPase ExeA
MSTEQPETTRRGREPSAPSSPLEAFVRKHEISLSKLATLCGKDTPPSVATMHRLLKNQLSPFYARQWMHGLAGKLPNFLINKGLDRSDIDRELSEVFQEGEYQPMISQRVALSRKAVKHFGLSSDPFAHPPQSRDEVYISPALQEVIDSIFDAVQYQGFVCVTGDIGSGKSTLRAMVDDKCERDRNLRIVWSEFFDMKNVTPMQIAEAILRAFDAEVPRNAVRRGKEVKELLASLYQDGIRVALGFDECHRLSDATLSSLKNFLEMSSGGFKRYLGVVLFGQTIFEGRLRDRRFRELLERIEMVRMPEFGSTADKYLAHRIQLAGGDVRRLFDADAIKLICGQATTPLSLGNIANEAMLISMDEFKNTQVIGAAIKTKMFFETNNVPAFRQRKAS